MHDTKNAADELRARFCNWAMEECRIEIDSDFSRLVRINEDRAAAAVDTLRGWSRFQRYAFMTESARQLIYISPPGKVLNGWRDEIKRKWLYERRPPQDSAEPLPPKHRFRTSSMISKIRKRVTPALGKAEVLSNSMFFRTEVKGGTLYTDITVCGSEAIEYCHWGCAGIGPNKPLAPTMNHGLPRAGTELLGWLGIGGPLSWEYRTEEEVLLAVDGIGEFIDYFATAFARMVDGLGGESSSGVPGL